MIKVGEFREGMPLSELIQLAVNDARKAVATGKYVLDGTQWHKPSQVTGGACAICLGGGVLAGLVDFDSDTLANALIIGGERELEYWESDSLLALDQVRYGDVHGALEQLEKDASSPSFEHAAKTTAHLIRCAFPEGGSIAPLETYEAAAQILAEVGL